MSNKIFAAQAVLTAVDMQKARLTFEVGEREATCSFKVVENCGFTQGFDWRDMVPGITAEIDMINVGDLSKVTRIRRLHDTWSPSIDRAPVGAVGDNNIVKLFLRNGSALHEVRKGGMNGPVLGTRTRESAAWALAAQH